MHTRQLGKCQALEAVLEYRRPGDIYGRNGPQDAGPSGLYVDALGMRAGFAELAKVLREGEEPGLVREAWMREHGVPVFFTPPSGSDFFRDAWELPVAAMEIGRGLAHPSVMESMGEDLRRKAEASLMARDKELEPVRFLRCLF
jgi:hypothetical protein